MSAIEKTIARTDSESFQVAGDTIRLLAGAESTGLHYEAFEVCARENNGPPPHTHSWREFYYMIDGEIDLTIDGTTMRLGPGSCAHVREGALHTHRIASASARFVLIADPAGVAAFFREIDRETQGSSEDIPKILSIAQRHGFTISVDQL